MSRHKLVKNLDIDDELDDYDGCVEEDAEEDELTADDKGTSQVSTLLECKMRL